MDLLCFTPQPNPTLYDECLRLICLLRSPFCLDAYGQKLHWNGRASEWTEAVWSLRLLFRSDW